MQSAHPGIQLRGVRHHNLKGFDLDLPLHRLIVITGPSGSGKSSLAFDTLFAEGQRRYIETFSPYARQFFDRMDKPRVDQIRGIPPAIAVEQTNSVKTTRSTVGTMTEICDYLKLVWSQLAQLYCRQCRQSVMRESPQRVWQTVGESRPAEVLITFDLPLSSRLSLADSLALIARQGYSRLLAPATQTESDSIVRVDQAERRLVAVESGVVTVIQDRLKVAAPDRARFMEACEQAYHFGKGRLAVRQLESPEARDSVKITRVWRFSRDYHCAACDLSYPEPTPALFSFNHPIGACPACRGFGRIITIDYSRAIPDPSKTLAEGAVKPWQTGKSAECQEDLLKFCRRRRVPVDVPFARLSSAHRAWVIEGDPHYGEDREHEWPQAWYGLKGYFRWLESKSYKMHMRVLLSRYRAYQTCPDCQGSRFQPLTRLYRLKMAGAGASEEITLAEFLRLPVSQALPCIDAMAREHGLAPPHPLGFALEEVRARLSYLAQAGLDYLTLDRPTRSLSGGETERVNLATCLGTRLVNTLFVLDEPSVGLHPRDTTRLAEILLQLRAAGNTVVVVEHEAGIIRAADQVIDLGPGQGERGGQLVFQGSCAELLRAPASLTGQYLSGAKKIPVPPRRPVSRLALRNAVGRPRHTPETALLKVSHLTRHNLLDLSVSIPLGRLVCITGVSGSGKTTLIREGLLPLLTQCLEGQSHPPTPEAEVGEPGDRSSETGPAPAATINGWQFLQQVVLVDQSPLGKTPRSNPAVYIGAFDAIRDLFAISDVARQRGLNASAFSFNSVQGQCERCRGAGFEKIEMQFLSDVFIRCPDCQGRRYRPHVLEVRLPAGTSQAVDAPGAWSIADMLEATVDAAIAFLADYGEYRPAQRAVRSLRLLQEVGLGYLPLGQPLNTLSGGECQRLKLVSHLAAVPVIAECHSRIDSADAALKPRRKHKPNLAAAATPGPDSVLFLFDEPTTGLHFDDIRVLLAAFQRLVDAGHSVLVIEHNLEVIKCADWIIDLGPEGGAAGGRIVAEGTPEQVAACPHSHTGRFLKELLTP